MSSLESTFPSQPPTNTRFSKSLRFFSMRPLVKAVKEVFHQIKYIPLIRRHRSSYIPYAEWEAIQQFNQLEEVVSSTEGDVTRSNTLFDYEFAYREKRDVPRDRALAETTLETIDEQRTMFSSADGYEETPYARDTTYDGVDIEHNATASKEAGLSHTQLRTDLTIVTNVAVVSLGQRNQTKMDSAPDSEEHNGEIKGKVLPEEKGTKFEHEPESIAPELERLSAGSSRVSSCEVTSERASLKRSGVMNDATARCSRSAMGNCPKSCCQPAETVNENDDPGTHASGKASEKHVNSCEEEKSKCVEPLRKLVAAKEEARLRRSVRYKENQVAENESGRHVPSKASVDGKECSNSTLGNPDKLIWSREEAKEAHERRKRNQKERMMKLLTMAIQS